MTYRSSWDLPIYNPDTGETFQNWTDGVRVLGGVVDGRGMHAIIGVQPRGTTWGRYYVVRCSPVPPSGDEVERWKIEQAETFEHYADAFARLNELVKR